jgi:hypothetical protein
VQTKPCQPAQRARARLAFLSRILAAAELTVDCQRAHKRAWQRHKRAQDPDYCANERAA